jgi:hypothetical protein
MQDEQNSSSPDNGNRQDQKAPAEPANEQFLERWKDGSENRMGNDISSEVKIAESGGQKEGGSDTQWHMKENDPQSDADDQIGN